MSKSLDGMTAPIETTSGYLDVASPDVAAVPGPYDLGYALGKINRFCGWGTGACSVAFHSLRVMSLVRHRFPDDDGLALAALLHDAAEAFVGDVPSPVKRLIGANYRALEQGVATVIYEAYGLDPTLILNEHVHRADLDALALEAATLLPSRGAEWGLRDLDVIERPSAEEMAAILRPLIGPDYLEKLRYPAGGAPAIEDHAESWARAVRSLAPRAPESTVGPQCPGELSDAVREGLVWSCEGIEGHEGPCTFPNEASRSPEGEAAS